MRSKASAKSQNHVHIPPTRYSYPTTPNQTPSSSVQNGFLSNMVTGFALGTGSSLGHHAVNSIFSSGSTAPKSEQKAPNDTTTTGHIAKSCEEHFHNYVKCSENFKHDCDSYYNEFVECMRK